MPCQPDAHDFTRSDSCGAQTEGDRLPGEAYRAPVVDPEFDRVGAAEKAVAGVQDVKVAVGLGEGEVVAAAVREHLLGEGAAPLP